MSILVLLDIFFGFFLVFYLKKNFHPYNLGLKILHPTVLNKSLIPVPEQAEVSLKIAPI